MSIMGTRVLRTEDPRLLTGGGVYVDDLRLPELTWAAFATFVRSPMAHALITGIDAATGQQPRVLGPQHPRAHNAHRLSVSLAGAMSITENSSSTLCAASRSLSSGRSAVSCSNAASARS